MAEKELEAYQANPAVLDHLEKARARLQRAIKGYLRDHPKTGLAYLKTSPLPTVTGLSYNRRTRSTTRRWTLSSPRREKQTIRGLRTTEKVWTMPYCAPILAPTTERDMSSPTKKMIGMRRFATTPKYAIS